MRSVLCTERIPDNKSASRTSETFHFSPFTIHYYMREAHTDRREATP